MLTNELFIAVFILYKFKTHLKDFFNTSFPLYNSCSYLLKKCQSFLWVSVAQEIQKKNVALFLFWNYVLSILQSPLYTHTLIEAYAHSNLHALNHMCVCFTYQFCINNSFLFRGRSFDWHWNISFHLVTACPCISSKVCWWMLSVLKFITILTSLHVK